MANQDLTKKQSEVYDYLLEKTKKKGYPPTVREIMVGLKKTSTSTIHSHLTALEAKGYIIRDENKPRAIEFPRIPHIIDFATSMGEIIDLPVVGQVAAGTPILAEENISDRMPYPASYLTGTNFMLKVRGDSMINAGIFDGDLVVVHQQEVAVNGDIVVALLDDEATVKRYYRELDRIRLQPENDTLDPIYSSDVVIAGKVVGLIRTSL